MSDAVGPGEAARRLGVSTRTVQRWLREGRLPAVRVGSRLKVDASALLSTESEGAPRVPERRAIGRLLVANRGELVVRIARTCRLLGIRCLALVPEDQARAWWTSAADELVPLEGSYLDIPAVLHAARRAGADAIHPGYGFLAENPDFAQAVIEQGLIWVGPPPDAMRALGDKASARRLARATGVPTLPGYEGDDQSDDRLRREAGRLGYPVLLKPSGGGGGMGMHTVNEPSQLAQLLAQARREARAAFGDDRLVIERYLARPRHVEVQLLADVLGNTVHLGERECSLQRRHQKVIEESPSPAVDAALRARLGDAAVSLARAAGYQGAGTAEFLLAPDGSFYFLELNARLQVEHPVTELVTGRDLVAHQLAIAAREPLGFGPQDLQLDGHAIEARLYAEDPHADFLPAAGEVVDVSWPQHEGLRIDAGVGPGDVVGTRYDPLLAKLICHGRNRDEALARMEAALEAATVFGVTTNRGFLLWLLRLPPVRRGEAHTELIDEHWRPQPDLTSDAIGAAAAALHAHLASGRPAGSVAPGFRLNAEPSLRFEIDGQVVDRVAPREADAGLRYRPLDGGGILLDLEGRSLRVGLARPPSIESTVRAGGQESEATQLLTAAMPGNVLEVRVAEGEQVEGGQALLILEAMKMENAISAPAPGRVARVLVTAGQQVQRGDGLIELA